MATARTITQATPRFVTRERTQLWLGNAMPETIAAKEAIDNAIDAISERSQSATEAVIKISPNAIRVNDNGNGISTDLSPDNVNTHMFLAVAQLFTSSNYDGVSDTVGANGIGVKASNYTANSFVALNFNPAHRQRTVRGYEFVEGYLRGTDDHLNWVADCVNKEFNIDIDIQYIKDNSKNGIFKYKDKEYNVSSGDIVENPYSKQEALEKYKPDFENGYFVECKWTKYSKSAGTYSENPLTGAVFKDDIDIEWLKKYTEARVGELNSGKITFIAYSDDDFTNVESTNIWCKDASDKEHYVKSWQEKVEETDATVVKKGPWLFAFSIDDEFDIQSIIQGCLTELKGYSNFRFQIQDKYITLPVKSSAYYKSTEYPDYSDQTKVSVNFPREEFNNAFLRSGDVYKHYYAIAEKEFLKGMIKESDDGNFYPSLGKPEDSELIIAEGYSAISGIKAMRNANTQACIALRGKISNCWNLDIAKAMNSDIVKQILNAVMYNNYKQIIIATDMDPDGFHICTLLIGIFAKFCPSLFDNNKIKIAHSPHYLFKKKGAEVLYSDNAEECPDGYHVTTLKGLGGLTAKEIDRFLLNDDTRDLWTITYDSSDNSEDYNAIDLALGYGGKEWIK